MRRWVLLLLLAVLPLQFAQAMAASYCAHEKTVTQQHPGHHEHEHTAASASADDASPADADGAADKPSGAVDADCEYCHLSGAQPLVSPPASWTSSHDRPASNSLVAVFASCEGTDVERPNWSSAARSAGGRASPST